MLTLLPAVEETTAHCPAEWLPMAAVGAFVIFALLPTLKARAEGGIDDELKEKTRA